MEIGIGLPNTIAGTDARTLTEWARRADAAGFSSLGTIDRLVYPNLEPLVALAAAAAVTERITLATTILIAPYRQNAALLAKQAASVQQLSGGRLMLGLAIGGREDDYEASGVRVEGRGERFDAMLDEMRAIFLNADAGPASEIGPDVSANPPKIVIGGYVDAAYRRAARFDGWILGGGTPEAFAEGREKLLAAWREAGRDGEPYGGALGYFSLGPDAQRQAEEGVGRYYAWLGDYAQNIVDSVAKDAETVQQYARAFADAGCDELILFPSSNDPTQVDLLAEAALG
jgi:alkanesulfonate monooxygenase SsuD/methylene tetrahydromethanopterin reductase-like flavin-dependent oxidoreductase (luciferase family)